MLVEPNSALDLVWKWSEVKGIAQMRGPRLRARGETPPPGAPSQRAAGGCRAAGPSFASESPRTPRAERARRREPPEGLGPVSRPIRRFVPAPAAGGPAAGSRAAVTAPVPSRAASPGVPISWRPVARRTSPRRDAAGGGLRTLALPKEEPPPPEAHAGQAQAPKALDFETHYFQHPKLTQKFSTKYAMTIVPPPRQVPRPRPPAAV